MKDISFLEFVISGENHSLISADSRAYGIIGSDTLTAFEEYVSEDYREEFLENIERADDTWFPTRILKGDDAPLYYVRAARKLNTNMIRLIIVSIDELLLTHNELIRDVATYRAQLQLFEDVFFEYDPEISVVKVYNTQNARFDSGDYNVDDFENMLCKGLGKKGQSSVRSFIGQMKAKTGRFSVRVDGNPVNDDPAFTSSLLDGAYVFYYKNTESVVGHIHLYTKSGKAAPSSIKHDSLTGLVDKSDIMRIAQERIDDRSLEGTTLAIVDIDFFKSINDTYGHQFGDTVIKRTADIISTVVGNKGVAGRFGGDEFLIVFDNIKGEDELRQHLRSIKNTVSSTFSDRGIDENTPLSVSIGAAVYPNDAENYEDLFMIADHCLYIAKEKGRNRYIIYSEEKHGSLEIIRESSMTKKKINERGELSPGDVIVKMFDVTLHGSGASVEILMDEFAESFNLQHVCLFAGNPFVFRHSSGPDAIKDSHAVDMMLGILNSDTKERYIADRDFIVVNRIDTLPPQAGSIKNFLRESGVFSYILMRFFDKDGRECIMIISSVGKYTQWNQMQFKYYRAFADVLALYSLE